MRDVRGEEREEEGAAAGAVGRDFACRSGTARPGVQGDVLEVGRVLGCLCGTSYGSWFRVIDVARSRRCCVALLRPFPRFCANMGRIQI